MKKLFGTDGMRGEAGLFPLDAATMRATARALATHLAARYGGRAPRIVIGRDTRESGAWIEEAFVAGARAAGAECESAGVITTPGVAYLTRALPADAGVVISASHNAFHDNGIKIFDPTGRKLDDATERLIEADIYDNAAASGAHEAESMSVKQSASAASDIDRLNLIREGDAEHRSAHLQSRYLDYLADEIAAGLRLDGLRIVADCANGAASEFAPAVLRRLGAHVVAINDAPDGRNINQDCGSLHLQGLQYKVKEERADFGVAFDGDADRALFVDAQGNLVDGDATLWVLAKYLQERNELEADAVVATVMSNIGLELALNSRGVKLLRADVGDKYVLEELLRTGASLGGEQSGHIIFPRTSLAGDGIITTICVLRAIRESRRPLQELTEGFVRYPQFLTNVRVREKLPFEDVAEIAQCARETEAKLGASGRLLLRYSGTEPLARVMIEGERQDEIERLAHGLASVIKAAIGVV